jgi:hypothetical protein
VLQLTTLLRSLGPSGAVANAASALDDRRREEWVVEGLLRRIESVPAPAVLPARTVAPAAVA